eukprot:g15746.t1
MQQALLRDRESFQRHSLPLAQRTKDTISRNCQARNMNPCPAFMIMICLAGQATSMTESTSPTNNTAGSPPKKKRKTHELQSPLPGQLLDQEVVVRECLMQGVRMPKPVKKLYCVQ